MKTMTIHRALAELKTLDARISAATQDIDPIGIYQKDKPVLTSHGAVYADHKKFEEMVKGQMESIQKLIANKTAIKRAIVESNSITKVTVGDKEMTVAEAITQKSYIQLRKSLVERLNRCYLKSQGNYKISTEKVEKNLQTLLEASFGKDQTKVTPEDADAIRKPFLAANEFHTLDPIDVQKTVNEMSKEIVTFEADVDACLSESNAITSISIEE